MYTYNDLVLDILKFNKAGIETGHIGHTELGTPIPYVFVGDKRNCIIVQGAIHAREHITSKLIIEQINYILDNHRKINGGIYFVPMVNIDGVRLVEEGTDFLNDEPKANELIKINGSKNFAMWKANIDAVDLNVNFDADWGKGVSNLFFKAPYNYVGSKPNSAAETKALINFTHNIKPIATISYHTKGEIIYWKYNQMEKHLWRDYRLARFMAQGTGYQLSDNNGSVGGYKDWCIKELGIPSYTFEVGSDDYSYPYPYEQFSDIFDKNKNVPQKLLNTLITSYDIKKE